MLKKICADISKRHFHPHLVTAASHLLDEQSSHVSPNTTTISARYLGHSASPSRSMPNSEISLGHGLSLKLTSKPGRTTPAGPPSNPVGLVKIRRLIAGQWVTAWLPKI